MKFWKMHGLGNDFIVIDNRRGEVGTPSQLAEKLCRRRFSVGADGLILVEKSTVADVKMRIFNADGTEAEMCGNGIRCLVKYCYENGIARKTELTVETLAGVKKIWLETTNGTVESVKVDMGKPKFNRADIPMRGTGQCVNEKLEVNGEEYTITCLSVGNPHCVIFVNDIDTFPVEQVGPKIEHHTLFPERTNVEFAQLLGRNEITLRVWERGCGETFACGTGACAAAAAGKVVGKLGDRIIVHLRGGDLLIEYVGSLYMTGTAEKVYEGTIL
jgi:diaminopimelate epimerase